MGQRWYIQSQPTNGTLPFSCSFVEFDERGDYLDPGQLDHAWRKIRGLAKTNKLLLFIYCHGWKNDSESGNVVDFNRALSRLAHTAAVTTNQLRVHGLYLAWRGNVVKPYVDHAGAGYKSNCCDFGQAIVDPSQTRDWEYLSPSVFIEFPSYWSRKKAAEYRVSGVPLARTIFTAANVAKAFSCTEGWTNRVFVIGHSFGALMLERSLGQACVGALTQWHGKATDTNTATGLPATLSKLPFDLILFVNSAAPSIHTKELADLLSSHHRTGANSNDDAAEGRRGPVIVSVTSKGDDATGVAHPLANFFAPIYPSLQRDYSEGVLIRSDTNVPPIKVPQSYFYARTPGHNPLLVNHWITQTGKTKAVSPDLPANNEDAVLQWNLTNTQNNIFFTTSAARNATTGLAWLISTNSDPADWNQYKKQHPVEHSQYWIVRCSSSLISSHDAIWTLNALNMYTGLYRFSQAQPAKP